MRVEKTQTKQRRKDRVVGHREKTHTERTRNEDNGDENERGRTTISDLVYVLYMYIYIYRDGEKGLAMGRARGHRAAKATVRSGEIV